MNLTVPLLVLGVAAVALSASGKSNTTKGGKKMSSTKLHNKTVLYSKLRGMPMLTEQQRLFVILVAERESKYNVHAHNDTPSEVDASVNAWEHSPSLAQKLAATGYPKAAWTIGSGGYGGRLVPYFGDDMLDAGLGIHAVPSNVFVTDYSIISVVVNAWKLQQHDAWRSAPTIENLRAGFATLAWVGDAPADREKNYAQDARDAGLPEGFTKQVIGVFPSPAQGPSMLAALRQVPDEQ